MSVQTALVAIKSGDSTLNTLIGTRFQPDVLEQDVTLPAVRFQVVSRTREYTMGATDPQLSHPRVQIDGYASTSTGRTTLASALRGAFNRYRGTIGGETIQDIRILNELETVEMMNTNTKAYRIMMDVVIDMEE